MPETADELVLTPDQNQGLADAAEVVDAARAVLGEAYLRYEEAKLAFERMQEDLKRKVAQARQAEGQHRAILQRISQALQLPDGEWVYDQSTTKLIRKGASRA